MSIISNVALCLVTCLLLVIIQILVSFQTKSGSFIRYNYVWIIYTLYQMGDSSNVTVFYCEVNLIFLQRTLSAAIF